MRIKRHTDAFPNENDMRGIGFGIAETTEGKFIIGNSWNPSEHEFDTEAEAISALKAMCLKFFQDGWKDTLDSWNSQESL